MQSFNYKELTVELVLDNLYSLNSTDNTRIYDFVYNEPEDKNSFYDYPKYGVFLKNGENEILNSALIIGVGGGATSPHEKSALIRNDEMILIIGNGIICLELPSLKPKWTTKTDNCYTCFEIHEIPGAFIIYAEGSIIRINYQGTIIWEFMGRDIFVMLDGTYFKIESNHIFVKDWDGNSYELTYDGKEIV